MKLRHILPAIGTWRCTFTFKVAHLDFSEAHHPNFERLVLYRVSSVGHAASHIYQRLNKLVKKVSLIDIGVTVATKR